MPTLEPLNIMQEFLLDVIEEVPEELAMHVRSIQGVVVALKHELETLERIEERSARTRNRIRQQLEYLQMRTMALADTATKATVIEPLAVRLKKMVQEVREIDFFGGPDAIPGDDRSIADRGGPDKY